MIMNNNLKTTPIKVQRSKRLDRKTVITSCNAGKIAPVAVIPLLREDAVQTGRIQVQFEAMEMAETIFNGINCKLSAYLVPKLAESHFNGEDDLNRSYMGIPREDGETPIPYIQTHTFNKNDEFYKTLGIHATQGSSVNRQYLEAYNMVVNHMRTQVSPSLDHRTLTDATLAPAFWNHTSLAHIKPDFDQAIIDGEVSLSVGGSQILPIKSSRLHRPYNNDYLTPPTTPSGNSNIVPVQHSNDLSVDGDNYVFDEIFVELAQSGISISLANIDLARKTQAFAKARTEFQGHSDEYIVDLLMSAIRIPQEELRHPILLAEKTQQMGYQQRFATDASNLDEHVTSGGTVVDLSIRTPAINCGGTIIVVAQITPDQIYERQQDVFLSTTATADYPEYTSNFLDPEPVEVVLNNFVDCDHSDPTSVFGYAPLNHGYMRTAPNIGGKYYRPDTDASFDEERQKFWANESVDPELTSDFYMCTDIHHKIFADSTQDNFELTAKGEFLISGNTVFGPALIEATDDYDEVLADVDQTKIVKS